jgi:outer membrane receptor protein involved in Fe transport
MTGVWHAYPDRLPNEKTQQLNATTKLTWALSPTMRLGVVGLLEDRGRLFGWKNSTYMDRFRYFLEGVPKWDGMHITAGVKWSHFLSRATAYELQVSVVHDNVRRGFCDDNNDGVISPGEDGDFLTWADKTQVIRYQADKTGVDPQKSFIVGGSDGVTYLLPSPTLWKVARPPIHYENSTSRNITLKSDLSSQVDPHHLLGAGAQLRLHTVGKEIRNGYSRTGVTAQKPFLEEIWTRHPAELGFYLQDRMEYSGLIVNVGFRLEGMSLDAAPIVNWYDFPDTVVDAQWGPLAVVRRGALLPWKWFLSPRVGFSHPIGNDAAVHVSFSRTRLSLPFSYLFGNYFTRLALSTMVNLDQETISAMNYDLGFQWSVLPATLLGVNAYYHDYNNMYGALLTLNRGPGQFYVRTNAVYSEARGIEISLQRDLVPLAFGISAGGRLAYTYSRVSVGNPVPANKTDYSAFAGDSAAYNGGLPFYDITLWNKSNIEVLGGNSTLLKGFSRNHRITCAFTIAFPRDFRLSGTGMFNSGFWYPLTLKADYVLPCAESPWNRRIDVRLEKQFVVSGKIHLDFFIDVLNLFNWTNLLAYYRELDEGVTAPQIAWEVYGDPTGGVGYNRPVTPDGSLIYDIPREVYFGVRLGF